MNKTRIHRGSFDDVSHPAVYPLDPERFEAGFLD
jgi:hypothetical protein